MAYEAPSLATGYGAYLAQVSHGTSNGKKRRRNVPCGVLIGDRLGSKCWASGFLSIRRCLHDLPETGCGEQG